MSESPIQSYEDTDPVYEQSSALPVEVVNFPVVQEGAAIEPNCRSFNETGQVLDILQLDPYRSKATLVFSGTGTVVLCHSETNANGVVNEVAPESYGAVIVCPGASNSFTLDYTATGKLWAVLSGASPLLSVFSERRNTTS